MQTEILLKNKTDMKKVIIIANLMLFLISYNASSQCLPDGITFTTQSQINNFQTNYPGCTEIEGDVFINGFDIANLNGLSVLNSINGNLIIGNELSSQPFLTDLTGLDNLDTIGGDLRIEYNEALSNLTGLDNLTAVGGDLRIEYNEALTSLSGLNNVEPDSIGNLFIRHNNSLTTCEVQGICNYLASPNGIVSIHDNASGCNNPPEIAIACGITLPCLPYGNYYFYTQTEIDEFQTNYTNCTEIEGDVFINGDSIANLNGLSTWTSIGGNLWITSNDALISLTGLDSVVSIEGDLWIYINNALTNLTALENLISIGGKLLIGGNDSLTSLIGLENITSIEGKLGIGNNDLLTDLTGLDNITSIGGGLQIGGNDLLTSLTGLNNVISIGEDLIIYYNESLSNLSGLANLTSIGGELKIGLTLSSGTGNPSLSSLAGLDNINAGSIENINIVGNESLITCEIQSICDYLSSPNGTIEIHDNAPGCNSQSEVEYACLVGEFPISVSDSRISIYPNPTTSELNISSKDLSIFEVNIYNQLGQIVLSDFQPAYRINVSSLNSGIYFIELITNKTMIREKLIIK